MHLRIGAAKTGDISLITGFIEPAEHQVKLFTQDEPNKGQGKLLKLHVLAQDATEDLGSFEICQFASGNLQFLSNKFGRALESQGHECSNVVGGNGLVRLITTGGVC